MDWFREQRRRVDSALSAMIEEVYRTHLRRMQGDMHSCAAACCKDAGATLETSQACIEDCGSALSKAQRYLISEIGEFQGSLEGCIVECNRDVMAKVPKDVQESALPDFQRQIQNCTVRCVDKHIAIIPDLMRSMKRVLGKASKASEYQKGT